MPWLMNSSLIPREAWTSSSGIKEVKSRGTCWVVSVGVCPMKFSAVLRQHFQAGCMIQRNTKDLHTHSFSVILLYKTTPSHFMTPFHFRKILHSPSQDQMYLQKSYWSLCVLFSLPLLKCLYLQIQCVLIIFWAIFSLGGNPRHRRLDLCTEGTIPGYQRRVAFLDAEGRWGLGVVSGSTKAPEPVNPGFPQGRWNRGW